MEYTILGCDLCPKRPRPRDAVTSRTLVNGRPRKGDPSLDLCRAHAREVDRRFTPIAATGRPRADVARSKPKKRQHIDRRRGKAVANLAEAERRVLAALRIAAGAGLRGAGLATAAKLGKAMAAKAARSLAKKGEIRKRAGRMGYVAKEAA